MIHSLLAVALLLSPAAPDELTDRLDDVLFRLENAQGARTWDLASELRDAARADSIQAVPHLLQAARGADSELRLVIGRTLLDLDAPDEAAEVLLGLLSGDAAVDALGMLADKAFRRVSAVAEALSDELEKPGAPSRRIALARTLYKVSRSGRSRTTARRVLLDTLESDDPDVRAEGALALAEISDFEPARSVLRTLTADPGPRGQLARAYLDMDEKVTYYTDKLYRQSEQSGGGSVNSGRPAWGNEAYSSGPGSLDVLEELIDKIQTHHLLGEELDDREGRERLISAAAKGMLSSLDQHSTYFSSKEYERWILDLRRNYAGIGAYVDTLNGVFTITKPIYSGPAYGAGLQSGDQILRVDGWETYNQTNDEIIRRLKGEPGTEVTVTVYRNGWHKERDFVVERNVIHIDSVQYDLLPGDIGYAEVLSFAEDTWRELALAVDDMKSQGMRGLILDLRNNSGGYLNEAVSMCSLFMNPGELVVYTEGRGVNRENFYTHPLPAVVAKDGRPRRVEPYLGPLTVLVNPRSASASEIVSGALQEAERAQIVGSKTFGKGSVQQAMPIESRPGDRLLTDPNGNRVYDPGEQYDDVDGDGKYSYPVNAKITNARYYLKSGRSLHTERDLDGRIVKYGGVEPDVATGFEGLAGWENHELAVLFDALGEADPFRDYVRDHWDEHSELFMELAAGDDHDTSRYPAWDEFRAALDTPLPDDTLRLVLRARVRDRVADARGKAFPGGVIYGDWQEDNQLQLAIAVLADELSLDLGSYDAYDQFADILAQTMAQADEDEPEEG